MNANSRRKLLQSALAGLVAMGLNPAASAQDSKGDKEKC